MCTTGTIIILTHLQVCTISVVPLYCRAVLPVGMCTVCYFNVWNTKLSETLLSCHNDIAKNSTAWYPCAQLATALLLEVVSLDENGQEIIRPLITLAVTSKWWQTLSLVWRDPLGSHMILGLCCVWKETWTRFLTDAWVGHYHYKIQNIILRHQWNKIISLKSKY